MILNQFSPKIYSFLLLASSWTNVPLNFSKFLCTHWGFKFSLYFAGNEPSEMTNGTSSRRRSRRSYEQAPPMSNNLPLDNAVLQELLDVVMHHEDAWPFLRPVTKGEVSHKWNWYFNHHESFTSRGLVFYGAVVRCSVPQFVLCVSLQSSWLVAYLLWVQLRGANVVAWT